MILLDLSNENIIHIRGKEVQYLQFKKLLKYKELVHCYTLSVNEFDIAGNDSFEVKKQTVIDNYKKLANELNIDYNHIIRPYQTHTNVVKNVDNRISKITIFPEEYKNVDGLITNKKDIIFSLSFADCTPLLFYDYTKKVIANVHSGWKGTLGRIAQVTVKNMVKQYGCNVKDIICAIGPCIKKCHFEVSDDVKNLFYNEFKDMKDLSKIITYVKTENGRRKYCIDTTKININMLQEAGLLPQNIIDSRICTVCNADKMHSYRKNGEIAGRNTLMLGKI